MFAVYTMNQTHIVRRSFACTRDELPVELARTIGYRPEQLIGYQSILPTQRHLDTATLYAIYRHQTTTTKD